MNDQDTQTFNFGAALSALKAGQRVSRRGWNGKGLWLELQRPDAHSKMTLPYVFLSYPADAINTPSARVPWLASQTDLLADDWRIMEAPIVARVLTDADAAADLAGTPRPDNPSAA